MAMNVRPGVMCVTGDIMADTRTTGENEKWY
jgi:hypothetical protein